MFVWVFHRVSGLLLIALLTIKFLTAFFLMTKGQKPDWALVLHTNPLTDTFLIISGVYHAFYGIRTVIMDLGFRNEKLLFRVFTLLGGLASGLLVILYFTRDY
jgi:succinate dehydrogenase/fumarate reductase cytochrome b subunit